MVPASKDTRRLLHLTWLFIALVAAIVGIYAVFKYHNESGIPNMYTLHSWIGMSTICLCGIQVSQSTLSIIYYKYMRTYLYAEHTSIYVLVELWPPCSDCINLVPIGWKVCLFSPCEWPEVFFNITLVQESIKRSPCVVRIVAFWPPVFQKYYTIGFVSEL